MRIYLPLFIYFYLSLCRSENEVDIKDAGVGFIAPDDIAMIFYITLENNCDRDYEISVCMQQCCENTKPNENYCGYMYLIGGYMGVLSSKSCRNITLIHPNLYLFNRQGACTIEIQYRNQNAAQKITTQVEYKTSNCEEQPQCPTSDLDPLQNCSPVECVAKYSGGKNFFNPKCRECECVPICATNSEGCESQIAYSIATNTCINIHDTLNMTDLELLEKNDVDMTECEQTMSNTLVCHHGYMDTSGKCACHHGWTTTTDDEIYEPSLLLYHMCNIETGAWSCINKGRIKTTTLLISIFALTIASKILILMCILNWFYRRFRGKQRVCSSKLDPEDETILLCEDLSGAEKCLCDEPPENKKKLRKETVNVGFYPCYPSGYSSLRVSSASVRSKYMIKTDPSILLSHTTTSSIPVSFQSETDATTEDSEAMEDEDNYEIEFSGEEEDEYLQDVVCVPQEMYGEDDGSKATEDVMGEDEEEEDKLEYVASAVSSGKSTEVSRKGTRSSKSKTVSIQSNISIKSDK